MNDRLKGIPVSELVLVAVQSFVGEYEGDDGQLHPDYEVEVVNDEWYEKLGSPTPPRQTICSCCGHSLKVACLVAHKPTSTPHYVGRDCARKIENFSRYFGVTIERITVAMGERIKCNQRQAEFLKKHPETAVLFEYAKQPTAHRIAKEMVEKIRRWGDISEKQIALWAKVKTEDEAHRAKVTGSVPTGRQRISGYVISLKAETSPFGTVTKALVEIAGGIRVWGNLPSNVKGVEKGQHIEFTASFEVSKKDPTFGLWKRPTKFVVDSMALPRQIAQPMISEIMAKIA